MTGRPTGAVPPGEAGGHAPADVGLPDLPNPNGSAPFPELNLPPAATDGFELSGAELPDFFL